MARLEFIDTSDNRFEIVIEAGFTTPLDRGGIIEVMRIIMEVENDPKLDRLRGWNGELTYVEITKETITLRFRYPTIESPDGTVLRYTSAEQENKSVESVQYLMYLCAKIDDQFPLNDVPFPPSFRAFLSLPDKKPR